MNPDIQVAVVSHRRPDVLTEKTLRLLAARGVPKDQVRVFVEPSQLADYHRSTDQALAAEVVASASPLAANHNFVTRYYAPGTWLVHMDDDVSDVMEKVDDKTTRPVGDLASFFNEAFRLTVGAGVSLWGVYPVFNAMFMKNMPTTDLRFCIGQLFGTVNTHEPHGQVTLDQKNDYERTLRYFEAEGAVVRFNHVACKSPMYQPGGLQSAEFDRQTTNRRVVAALLETWPRYVRLAKRRGRTGLEIRLVAAPAFARA